jgi:hypothetical protein
MHQQVLSVRRPEPHFTHDPDQFFVQAVNSQFDYRSFPDFHYLFFNLPAGLFHNFFDPGRVNAAIGYQPLQ